MAVVTMRTLLLAALGTSAADGDADGPEGRTIEQLLDTVVGDGDRLSRQVELLGALDTLEDAGQITYTEQTEQTRVRLTETGADRAQQLQTELGERAIELVDTEGRREVPLKAAAAAVDRSPVSLAAACSEDGVYHVQTDIEPDGIVGRERELKRLDALFGQVQQHRSGRAAVLVGHDGCGKTTVAEEALAAADAAGATVLRTQCRGTDAGPFHPLRELIAQLDADSDPFGETGPSVDDYEAFRAQQQALFHDITELFAPGAGEPIRVLFFDDVDLFDPATSAYCAYLFEELSELPLVLLGSYRPGTLGADEPWRPEDDTTQADRGTEPARKAEGDEPGQASVERQLLTPISLEPLEKEQTRALIEQLVGRRGVPEPFLEAVYDRTDGNPLFVETTVETLLETDQLDCEFDWYPTDPSEIELPERIQETILAQLNTLAEPTRELLRWAAVAGDSVSVSVLAAVGDWSESTVRTTVDLLVEADVFLEKPGQRSVSFRNDLTREALHAALPADDRQRRHERIAGELARAVETESDDEADEGSQPASIASHHEAAGNSEAAIRWYQRATDRAIEIYAHEAAIEHAHGALELARSAADAESVRALGERIAKIHKTTGNYDEASRYVQFLRERTPAAATECRQRLARLSARIATAQGEYGRAVDAASNGLELSEAVTPERCRLLGKKAHAELKQGAHDEARATANTQLAVAQELAADRQRAEAIKRLGTVAIRSGSLTEARERFEAALTAYEAVDDRHGIAKAANNLGCVARVQRQYDDAEAAFERARDGFLTVGDRHQLAKVSLNVGNVRRDQCEFEAACESIRQAIEEFQAVSARHGVGIARTNLGIALLRQARYTEARRQLEAALKRHREIDNATHTILTLVPLARINRLCGESAAAGAALDAATDRLAETDAEYLAAAVATERGALSRLSGAVDRARTHFETATYDTLDDRRRTARGYDQFAALARQEGALDEAEQLLETARTEYESVHDRRGLAIVQLRQGRLARDRGAHERGLELVNEARQTFDSLGVRHWRARARLAAGTIAVETGNRSTALDRYERATETFEAIGAVPDAVETLRRRIRCCRDDQPDTSLVCCRRAIELREATDDDGWEPGVDWFREQQRSIAAGNSERP